MDNLWQQALADVVRAELALSDRTAKDAYTSLGISSTAWQTYFKRQSRDIPMRVLLDLAEYLRMPLSALLAKAETREAYLRESVDPAEVELMAGLSPRNRARVESVEPAQGNSSERPTRKNRSA